MIISKKLIPSLALIEDDQKNELDWLIATISGTIKKIYKGNDNDIEHGMCACIGVWTKHIYI